VGAGARRVARRLVVPALVVFAGESVLGIAVVGITVLDVTIVDITIVGVSVVVLVGVSVAAALLPTEKSHLTPPGRPAPRAARPVSNWRDHRWSRSRPPRARSRRARRPRRSRPVPRAGPAAARSGRPGAARSAPVGHG